MTARSQIHARRAIERCERLAKLGPPPPWWRVWKLRRWLASYRAIMALDISEAAEMLRDLYPASEIEHRAHAPNVFAAMVKCPPPPPGSAP